LAWNFRVLQVHGNFLSLGTLESLAREVEASLEQSVDIILVKYWEYFFLQMNVRLWLVALGSDEV